MEKTIMIEPLVIFAMKEERSDQFNDYNTLDTGIGKINAVYTLTKYLAKNKPDIIINMGTAGSRTLPGGSVVNPTEFIQRDMDVTALGFEQFQTPFSDDLITLKNGIALPDLSHGTCGTGDNFDVSEHANNFDVVDMEAYALALICHRENIPFICLKYISDGADDNASTDWNDALKRAAKALRETLDTIKFEDLKMHSNGV